MLAVVGAVVFAVGRVDCSRGFFYCCLLLVLLFLLFLVPGRWDCALLLMLHFLLPVASTVFVVFLFAGWRIDGFAADLFCGGPILWGTGD